MSPLAAWIAVAVTVAGLSVGQILFKIGASRLNEASQPALSAWAATPIVAAVLIYGVCTLLWISALRVLPLRLAYPFSALAFLIVPVLANAWLDEPLTVRMFVGSAVIVAGVWITTSAG